jgi:mRNA interferase MazF
MTSRFPWTPGAGDLIWVRTGEPATAGWPPGQRPAFVLSPAAFSARTGVAIVCAVVDEGRGYPFEVAVPPALRVNGVILADRVRSLDVRSRPVRLAAALPDEVVEAVRQRLLPLIAPGASP